MTKTMSQLTPTKIDVSDSLGPRVIELRRELGWSQKKLHESTKEIDSAGLGVSIRRIRALERQEDFRFRFDTLTLIAKALNLTLNQFLRPDLKVDEILNQRPDSPVPATQLFNQELELLQGWVKAEVPMIIVEGAGGDGEIIFVGGSSAEWCSTGLVYRL